MIPQKIISTMNNIDWNLGDVYITDGVAELMELLPEDDDYLDRLLRSHLKGDYGLINGDPLDLSRTKKSREAGRTFTSLYQTENECIKIKTLPELKHTVICLVRED